MKKASRVCFCGGECPHVARALELEREKRPRLCEAELHRVLIDAPDCARAHAILARVLVSENRARFAIAHMDAAIAESADAHFLTQKANALIRATKIPAAIETARQAANRALNDPWPWGSLVEALRLNGELVEAGAIVEQLDARFAAGDRLAYRRSAALVAFDRGDYERAIARLADTLVPIEIFDRGRAREQLGDYAGAWSDWMAAQELLRKQGCVWNEEAQKTFASNLYEIASPSRRRYLKACPPIKGLPQPIFITGFPRSGTTMIEAMLSSHPKIIAGDELPFLREITERLPALLRVGEFYPRCLMASGLSENEGVMEIARDFYIKRALASIGYGAKARFFTDKMLSNEKHLLLISLLFPASAIFHLRRHPLDMLISNMSYWLLHGGYASCSPEWFAKNFVLFDELYHYLREVLPDQRVHEIRYESFVAEHLDQVDQAMTFLGLKTDPACYDFHKSTWHSHTISARQIKEPVNAKSVKRYERFLEFIPREVLEIFAPAMGRAGYRL